MVTSKGEAGHAVLTSSFLYFFLVGMLPAVDSSAYLLGGGHLPANRPASLADISLILILINPYFPRDLKYGPRRVLFTLEPYKGLHKML